MLYTAPGILLKKQLKTPIDIWTVELQVKIFEVLGLILAASTGLFRKTLQFSNPNDGNSKFQNKSLNSQKFFMLA